MLKLYKISSENDKESKKTGYRKMEENIKERGKKNNISSEERKARAGRKYRKKNGRKLRSFMMSNITELQRKTFVMLGTRIGAELNLVQQSRKCYASHRSQRAVSVHGAGCGFTNQLVMEKPGSTCT
jgi:hypothetical protein